MSALEGVIKEAALEGLPLQADLKLVDDQLIVDEGLRLTPPAPVLPRPEPREPPMPAGQLSATQLGKLVKKLSKLAPDGWVKLADAAQALCNCAAIGILPEGWHGVSQSQMMAALRPFDPTHTTYVEWREVVCSLIAASFSAIMKATSADMADQVTMLNEADDNKDGLLTNAQWKKIDLWFQYKAFLPGSAEDLEASSALTPEQQQKQAYDRATALKAVLWDMFVDGTQQVDFRTVLLYLSIDRDIFSGIKKAISIATHNIATNARADGAQVMRVAYPVGPELGKPFGRSPFDLEGVQTVVSTIYESRKPAAAAAAGSTATKGAPAAAAAAAAAATAAEAGITPTVTAEQLIYSAGGERLVAQVLHRYQWKDIYVATKLA